MTDPTRPTLDHAPACQRRRAPMLRLSWERRAEIACPDCGRYCPANDTRTTDLKEPRP